MEEGTEDDSETESRKDNVSEGLRARNAAADSVRGPNQNNASAGTNSDAKLTDAEKRETGIVSRLVLWAYVKAMGGLTPFLILMSLFIVVEALRAMAAMWLSYWTGALLELIHGVCKWLLFVSCCLSELLGSQLCLPSHS